MGTYSSYVCVCACVCVCVCVCATFIGNVIHRAYAPVHTHLKASTHPDASLERAQTSLYVLVQHVLVQRVLDQQGRAFARSTQARMDTGKRVRVHTHTHIHTHVRARAHTHTHRATCPGRQHPYYTHTHNLQGTLI
jgi:hypothetical protein